MRGYCNMSMTLKKIELWNIRSHEHFLFEPDLVGITSVSGENGVGKSTIVDSFGWALYGIKANNVKNKKLIRDGASTKKGKDLVQVEVEVIVNNVEYLIRRRIISDSGGVECNVYGRLDDSEEYNHLAGPSVSSAETYIKNIFKMDEKGFLTAILIQQKQVDQIVVSSPRERGEVIEKLTGIQSITEGITLAKDEAREYQRAANSITVSDTDELRLEIEEKITNGKKLSEYVASNKEQLINDDKALQEKFADYELEESKTTKDIELKNKLELIKNNRKMYKSELDKLTKLLEKYKKENDTMMVSNLKEIEATMAQLNEELNDEQLKYSMISEKIKTLTDERNMLEEAQSLTKAKTSKKITELKGALEETTVSIESTSNQFHETTAMINQSKKSLETLGSGNETCPVCKSHISDPVELENEIKSELDELTKKKSELASKGKRLESEKALIIKDIKKYEAMLESFTRVEDIKDEVKSLKVEMKSIKEKLSSIKIEHKTADIEYKSALKISAKADEIKRSKERVIELSGEISECDNSIKVIESELADLNAMTTRALSGLRNKLDRERNQLSNRLVELNKREEELKYERLRVSDLKEKYKLAIDAKERHEVLVDNMKKANVTGALLSDFKEERIKYAIPTLEMYASTVLSKFTEGKFIKLELDSKFNTSVTTDTGVVRSISDLSGGELSAAAIALRVGISMLLNDGENNVLILDEILVSMDELRARHIIETISSMINCQIIFIAHNPEIQNVADKNIQIEKVSE